MRKIFLTILHLIGLWPLITGLVVGIASKDFELIPLFPILYYQSFAVNILLIILGWYLYLKKKAPSYVLLILCGLAILSYVLLPPLELFD